MNKGILRLVWLCATTVLLVFNVSCSHKKSPTTPGIFNLPERTQIWTPNDMFIATTAEQERRVDISNVVLGK